MWIILLAWNHNKAWNTRLKKGKEQSAFGAEGINEQYSQSQFSSFYWLIHPGNFKKALCSANHFPQLSSSLRELFGSAFAGQASYEKPATRSNGTHHHLLPTIWSCVGKIQVIGDIVHTIIVKMYTAVHYIITVQWKTIQHKCMLYTVIQCTLHTVTQCTLCTVTKCTL